MTELPFVFGNKWFSVFWVGFVKQASEGCLFSHWRSEILLVASWGGVGTRTWTRRPGSRDECYCQIGYSSLPKILVGGVGQGNTWRRSIFPWPLGKESHWFSPHPGVPQTSLGWTYSPLLPGTTSPDPSFVDLNFACLEHVSRRGMIKVGGSEPEISMDPP